MAVVECRHEPHVWRTQHAVAEHVAAHVTDADGGDVVRIDVDTEFAEVPCDAHPGTASGDTHRLVVVSDRAAGGERVSEPEAVANRFGVGDIGERGGSLVCGHHQI